MNFPTEFKRNYFNSLFQAENEFQIRFLAGNTLHYNTAFMSVLKLKCV